MSLILETDLPNLYYRGKVRDLYQLGDELLIVATDRISAFDSVLPSGIPSKGLVLNQLSAFWFEKTSQIVPNHVVKVVDDVNWLNQIYGVSFPSYIARRSMLVRKSERIPVECVVRGYISGSAWAEYTEKGTANDPKTMILNLSWKRRYAAIMAHAKNEREALKFIKHLVKCN